MADQAPFGTWRSSLTAQDVARVPRLRTVAAEDSGAVWWQEVHPTQGGRAGVMRGGPGAEATKMLVADIDAIGFRNGAGPWLPVSRSAAVAAGDDGHRLFLLEPGEEPLPLTGNAGEESVDRCSDLVRGPDGDTLWCVRETDDHAAGMRRSLVAVPLDGSLALRTPFTTAEHLSTPRPSPDGAWLAWLQWPEAQMPWDGSELRVGRITAEGLTEVRTLLGGPVESVFQPEWASSRSLYAVSDRTRWWNLYQVELNGALRPLCPWAEEFGRPQREDGLSTYGCLPGGRLAVLHGTEEWRLDVLDPSDGTVTPMALPYTAWQPTLRVGRAVIAGVAGGPASLPRVVAVDPSNGQHSVLNRPVPEPSAEYLPLSRPAVFTARDGHEVHAVVHPPRNPHFRASGRERVPFLLFLNDDPAAEATGMLDLTTAFFTSRGLGVAEIHGRGSSGYGRSYREQIYGRWGTADVEDCAVAVRALAEHWEADPARMVVRGTGAGGNTALAVLADTDLCSAATVYAPVTDLGPTAPGAPDALADRLRALACDSALLRPSSWPTTRIHRPVLMLHGLHDSTVPATDTVLLRDRLQELRIPHACLIFADEGHVFRKAETITYALEAELSFYGQVLGFHPQQTPYLRMHGLSDDEHPASSDTSPRPEEVSTRMTSRAGTPAPHNRESSRELPARGGSS